MIMKAAQAPMLILLQEISMLTLFRRLNRISPIIKQRSSRFSHTLFGENHYMQASSEKIAILGLGTISTNALIALLKAGYKTSDFIIFSPRLKGLTHHTLEIDDKKHCFDVAENNFSATEQASRIILGFKPIHAGPILQEIAPALHGQEVYSPIAGVDIETLRRYSNNAPALFVRCMPNTPAKIGQGTGAHIIEKGHSLTSTQKRYLATIMNAFNCPMLLDSEDKMNAITATSGSGSAYVFLTMEAMVNANISLEQIKAAINNTAAPHSIEAKIINTAMSAMENTANQMGLSKQINQPLVQKTWKGAYALFHMELQKHHALETPLADAIEVLQQLRQRVISKGGTTHAAIENFKAVGLVAIIAQLVNDHQQDPSAILDWTTFIKAYDSSMHAAQNRAQELQTIARDEALQLYPETNSSLKR
jgi:pyrroline-5-carboxylate reductase